MEFFQGILWQMLQKKFETILKLSFVTDECKFFCTKVKILKYCLLTVKINFERITVKINLKR